MSKESDATLLNGHLEWLTKVGFSVDNILEWAEAEKSKRGTDSTQQSALSAEEPEQLALTVSVAIEKAFTDGGSRLTDKGQSQSSATVDDASNLEDFPAFHSGSGPREQNITPKRTLTQRRATGYLSKKPKAIEARVHSKSYVGSFLSQRTAITPRQQRVRIKRRMKRIIDLLKANPAAMPFTEFEKAADYDKVIKYPMCLNEIRDRINRHQCDSREIFCAEFDAIIENCDVYHAGNPLRKEQARKLKAHFDELVKKYLPDDSHLDILYEGLPSGASGSEDEGESQVLDSDSSSHDGDTEEDVGLGLSYESVLTPEM